MKELFSVAGQTALITGASSGIGKHFAVTLAKHGANVVLVGRNKQRLEEVEQSCKTHHVKALSICADVSKAADIAAMVETSQKHFSKVDILINAAGIAVRVPALDMTEQQWNDVMNINLRGTFLVCQAMSRWMIATQTAGRIINISSAAAFYTTLTRIAYSASKIAVESVTRSLALNLAPHHIRVNCISPGFIVTELTRDYLQTEQGKKDLTIVPMQRAAQVNELEGVLLLLASTASSYMTGSVIEIDGGFATQKV